MAGMDWFRWHHGAVTDPKFQLVARKSGASLPDVLAVWAYLLETASQSETRGSLGAIDCESIDCLFGFPANESRTADILKAMQERGLIDGSRVASWEKRQPKREREDTTNAQRQAAYKAKKSQTATDNGNQSQVTPDNANVEQVTPGNASSEQKTPRVDKSREEERKEEKEEAPASPPEAVIFTEGVAFMTRCGVKESNARSFLGKLRREMADDLALLELLERAERLEVVEPLSWLRAAADAIAKKPKLPPLPDLPGEYFGPKSVQSLLGLGT